MRKKTIGWLLALGLVLILGVVLILGMKNQDDHHSKKMTMSSSQMQMSSSSSSMAMSSSMSGMNMDESLPTDLPNANQPKYPVGSKITLEADHMTGMKGAKGTVAAAYDVKLYEVDYQPTNGGKKVSGHKWLTKEDFSDMMDHQEGDRVTLTSTHMAGMKGAKATITKVVNGPAYAVNYQPTNGGKMVMNHKYLVESEIKSR
ncbi:YdhK family protein [Fructobacillus evanidus]|uniref:LysM repeat (LysM) n=1 Tax=Fructobacillus evanidus TaxID=3064281 RepID=A0ABM9MR62_9LACO|nr:LysM repeat (LysM) [Fructobacillus sp. LMG 32999]CAK1230671.1 LysM repeat (LysM) [Fructobacillus sp. LMG 32999]CAK1233989.1 LysM repeat (LysM) [Fructobacillus sp. LMG 32999]CAK1236584.1 LysM repeat (LysM) [Fructobacillus sp. LMG 32999]CAK1237986.1 LysM repeat (LysM) [Fructobacillus sp. LMG 32999]